MRVRSLGWEAPLEKEEATQSSVLAWETPRTEEPGGLQSVGSQSRTGLRDGAHTSLLHSSPCCLSVLNTAVRTCSRLPACLPHQEDVVGPVVCRARFSCFSAFSTSSSLCGWMSCSPCPTLMDREAQLEVHPEPTPHLPPPPSSETGSAGLGRRISAHQPRLLASRGGEEPAPRGCAPGQGAPGAGGPRLELQRVRELQRGLGRRGQARGRAHQASSVLPAQGEGRGHLSPQPRAPRTGR